MLLKLRRGDVLPVGRGLRVVKFSKENSCVPEDLGTGKQLTRKLARLWEEINELAYPEVSLRQV